MTTPEDLRGARAPKTPSGAETGQLPPAAGRFPAHAVRGTGCTATAPRRVEPADPALPAPAVRQEPEALPKEQPE